MKILLTGATGFIGGHCLRALIQQGHDVTVCVRNPAKLYQHTSQLNALKADFSTMQNVKDWLPLLKDIEAVMNCVGIIAETKQQKFIDLHQNAPIALFKACEQAGVKKVIQISALGADEQAESTYHLTKRATDEVLQSLNLDWFIFQPSIVYGEGAQSMALFHALAALPVSVLMDGGEQMLQPVHVDDITSTMLVCLKPETKGKQILHLVGANPVSFKTLLEQLRLRLQLKPPPSFSAPHSLVIPFASLGKYIDIPALSADGMQMLLRGNTADKQPFVEFIKREPYSLQEKLINHPATIAEQWHARLFFMPITLRLTLAFLWLWSGFVSAFLYPAEQSYQLLVPLGITGFGAAFSLYGLAIMDALIGIATLCRYRFKYLLILQILLITGYSIVISFGLPEYFLHPFAPIVKNITLVVIALILLALEER
ncbi:MAG: NAD(P)H-binding protein [Methylococcaceae bacterium]|nr:NAD(P)H-binding protein [Methylococcaceae bacterium]